MITITKSAAQTVKVSLNAEKASLTSNVDVVFESPSRTTVELSKPLSNYGSGFYSFDITILESESLVDNTYIYTIKQSGEILKIGKVNLK